MDGGAWKATVYGVAKSWTRLSDFTFFLSIVPFGEGHGNPLQCSCLENPMDRGACWGCGLWGCRELDTTKQLTHTVYLCQKKASSEIFGSRPKHFSVDDKIMPIL